MTSTPKRGRPRKERWAHLWGGFWRNPKIRRLSMEARGVLCTAWAYAADQMTDGSVPLELLRAWCGTPARYRKIVGELTRGTDAPGDRPLLSITDGSIDAIAIGFTDHNISRADWEASLEADLARKGRKQGNPAAFPDGKPGDFPAGNGSDFQAVPLTTDEDEEDPDRSRALDLPAVRPAPAPAPERAPGPRLVESPVLGDPERRVRGLVVASFKRRWEAATRDMWPGAGRDAAALDDLARYFVRHPDGEARIEVVLEGYFSSSDAFVRSKRWPLGLLARDPGRYVAGAGYARPAPASSFVTTGPELLFPEEDRA